MSFNYTKETLFAEFDVAKQKDIKLPVLGVERLVEKAVNTRGADHKKKAWT